MNSPVTPRALLGLFVLGPLLRAEPAAIVRPEWGTGPAFILPELGLPSPADSGVKKYGYVFRGSSEGSVFVSGWNKTVSEQPIQFWLDDNRNRVRDEGETRPINTRIDYHVNSISVDFSASNDDHDGAWWAKKWLEDLRQRQADLRLTGIGDSGLSGTEFNNKSTFVAHAIRGPLRVSVYLSCTLHVAGDLRQSGTEIVRYSYESAVENAAKKLAQSYLVTEPDDYSRELSKRPSWAYVGGESAVAAYKAACDAGPAAAAELARAICGAWDVWANQHPQSTAPGYKGLYVPDMSPYWPRPADMPKGIVLKEGSRLPDATGPAAGLSYRSEDKKQNYDVWIYCERYERGHLYADAPVQLAKARLQEQVRSEFLGNQDFQPISRPLALYGADEARQILLPRSNVILFRCANVVVTVKGNGEATSPESFRTEEIARVVLAKLMNNRDALPSPPLAGLFLSEQEPWARILLDGKTKKIIVARCLNDAGKPAAGVRVVLSVDDAKLPARGILVPSTVLTDTKGEARFSYTAPATKADRELPGGSIVFRGSSAVGSPAMPVSDSLTVTMDEGVEIPLTVEFSGAQVINTDLCPRWIYGKPAMLRVRLKWPAPSSVRAVEADLVFRFDGNVVATVPFKFKDIYTSDEENRYQDIAYAFFTPDHGPANPKLDVQVQPRALISNDGHRYYARPQTKEIQLEIAQPVVTMRFHFTPVAVGSWANLQNMDPAAFAAVREQLLDFFRAVYPLPPDRIVDATTSNVTMPRNWQYVEVGSREYMHVLDRLQALHALRTDPGTYDYEVGLVPEDWMADYGLQMDTRPNAILIQVATGNNITFTPALAHEVGHHLRLVHTPVPDSDGAPGAFLVPGRKQVLIRMERPPLRLTDFMYVDLHQENDTWISKENYFRLLLRLTQ